MPIVTEQPPTNVSEEATAKIAARNADVDRPYNPQERSPLGRKEQPKVCPHCGQPMPQQAKVMLNHMNRYINSVGVITVMSRNEDKIDIQGVEFYRCDIVKRDEKTGVESHSSSFAPKVKA